MPRMYRKKICPVCHKEHRNEYEVCSRVCGQIRRANDTKGRESTAIQYRQTGEIQSYDDEFMPPMQYRPNVEGGDIWEIVDDF